MTDFTTLRLVNKSFLGIYSIYDIYDDDKLIGHYDCSTKFDFTSDVLALNDHHFHLSKKTIHHKHNNRETQYPWKMATGRRFIHFEANGNIYSAEIGFGIVRDSGKNVLIKWQRPFRFGGKKSKLFVAKECSEQTTLIYFALFSIPDYFKYY